MILQPPISKRIDTLFPSTTLFRSTDEDFKMAVRAQAIIPALADRLGLRASAGEADRLAHAVGQGGVQRLEQRSHALRHRIEPAFADFVGHRLYSLQIACPAMAMPSAGTQIGRASCRERVCQYV